MYDGGNVGHHYNHVLLVRSATAVGDGPARSKDIAAQCDTTHPTRPFHSMGLSFIGDAVDGEALTTVQIPDDAFTQAGATRVPTVARMDTLLAGENNSLVGPFPDNAPNTELVTVRKICFIPNPYLLHVLDEGLTPRQAWERIKGQIVTDRLVNECQHLIDWLRVSLTRHGKATDQPCITVEPPSRYN